MPVGTQRFSCTHSGPLSGRSYARKTLQAAIRHLHRQTHASATAANSNKKQTAVVGVGLGGLTAASILQKHGFSAVVFERDASQHSRRQGGVLDLHPESGQWALAQAGLTAKFSAAARPEGQDTRVLDKDGTVLWEEIGSTQMTRPEIDRPLLRRILLDSLHPSTVMMRDLNALSMLRKPLLVGLK